jgi:sulfofructose kinase
VGHAVVDHHFEVDIFPERPTKTPAKSYQRFGGGMAFNAAVAAARLGAQVNMVGRVGADEEGDFLRAQLRAEGVQTVGLESVAGKASSVSTVIVDRDGERHVFSHRGSCLAAAHELDTRVLGTPDAILVDPRWVKGAVAALKWAREHGVPSVLDADVAPHQDLEMLVPLADWAVFSGAGLAIYAPRLTQDQALFQAVSTGTRLAAVTLGAHGCAMYDGGPVMRYPALAIQPLDTTGAGDVFHAALTLAQAIGQSFCQAVPWASAAAAYKCVFGHGVLGAPRNEELRAWMQAYDENR